MKPSKFPESNVPDHIREMADAFERGTLVFSPNSGGRTWAAELVADRANRKGDKNIGAQK
jgi:hypothetical protein